MHIHDEVVIEADPRVSLDALCEQMGRTPLWAEGLILTASGYTSPKGLALNLIGILVGDLVGLHRLCTLTVNSMMNESSL